ncbi:KamA family radical SAM protein [Candidatus Ozemobacteraceae bacterium]|nr:KamA family radical SAM protein [Candidatus Ozemobacteraceae bacterium]
MNDIRTRYSLAQFRSEMSELLEQLRICKTPDEVRTILFHWVNQCQRQAFSQPQIKWNRNLNIIRDCARAMRSLLSPHGEVASGESLATVLFEISHDRCPENLTPAFFAEVTHLLRGVALHPEPESFDMANHFETLEGREAALARSDDLDGLWQHVEERMGRYADGLTPEALERRRRRRGQILSVLGATEAEWNDWRWQTKNIVSSLATLERLVRLSPDERRSVEQACCSGLPFGITPYYLSLFDDDLEAGRDKALRAQVIPDLDLVQQTATSPDARKRDFDFMREADTSPVDLITRRYPAICIFKPFNTCPQICSYCQRNWEIDQAMAPGALAPREKIEAALTWIREHRCIREVLVTGGDPLAMGNETIEFILERLAGIDHVDLIRFGSRVPVTMPMRIDGELAALLGRFREPGRREICLVTHVEHPYELTPEVVSAVDRVRKQGIGVYNQLVFQFFVSRRFESTKLRMLMRRIGIDPYYTFVPKGKQETRNYRVPIARILQEQREEARLLPGIRRTDEAVYNLPALGKNHLRAQQHRDFVGIRPDGSRVYEFHPWEKNIIDRGTYVGDDVPVLTYLERLAEWGENIDDYSGIWYYY